MSPPHLPKYFPDPALCPSAVAICPLPAFTGHRGSLLLLSNSVRTERDAQMCPQSTRLAVGALAKAKEWRALVGGPQNGKVWERTLLLLFVQNMYLSKICTHF